MWVQLLVAWLAVALMLLGLGTLMRGLSGWRDDDLGRKFQKVAFVWPLYLLACIVAVIVILAVAVWQWIVAYFKKLYKAARS